MNKWIIPLLMVLLLSGCLDSTPLPRNNELDPLYGEEYRPPPITYAVVQPDFGEFEKWTLAWELPADVVLNVNYFIVITFTVDEPPESISDPDILQEASHEDILNYSNEGTSYEIPQSLIFSYGNNLVYTFWSYSSYSEYEYRSSYHSIPTWLKGGIY